MDETVYSEAYQVAGVQALQLHHPSLYGPLSVGVQLG